MKTKTMNEIFSTNLRNQLAKKNMTQSSLAKNLDVTEASVSKWTTGATMPRPKMIDRICVLLGCTHDDLTLDHSKVVELAPEDILAEELHDNPRLFRLMFYASRLTDAELDELIRQVKK